MSETEQPRTLSTAIAAISLPSASAAATRSEDVARTRIAQLEREARALGATPQAALLFHEVGLLWESPLKHPRNAAVAYQSAFKLAPRFLANIRAARRLFSEVGNWQMAAQLLDAELAATDDPRPRAALLFEKGQVLEQRLSREGDALDVYAQALALEPQDVSLLCQLEQVFTEKADDHALVKVYGMLARAVTDQAARAHYLTAAGLVLEDRIKDQPAAAVAFRAAFAIDRRDPVLLAAMKRVAERENQVGEELAALAAEAESQGHLAGPTYMQIAKAYERLGQADGALAALLAARKVAPEDPLVLAELARAFEAGGRFEELADVLKVWAGVVHDESEQVSLNLRLTELYEEVLKRETEAVERYQVILARVPGQAAALAGLGKLYARAQNWKGLLQTFEAEAAAIDDPRTKAGRLYKAAEVLEEKLGDAAGATDRYLQCLQLSAGYLPAQKALTRLFEKHGRWADLVQMLEQDLLQTEDKEQQINTLHRIANIHEDRLDQLPLAVDALKRVLEFSREHLPTIRSLQRLYERTQQWKELIDLNEHEASFTGDMRQVLSLVHRNAEIQEDDLQDRAAATQAWERALSLSPAYLPALKALGRLYGQDRQWEKLVQMYRTEAEIAPTAEQAGALTFRIGELLEKLKDAAGAIAAYQEVLTLSPSHLPAVRALVRLYRSQGAWEALIEVLRAEAINRTDPVERANALFQAAAIWDDQLSRPDQAIEAYQEVIRLSPTHASALHELERLLSQKDDVKELIIVLDRQTQVGASQMKVSAYLKLARLYIDRLGEQLRAATYCDQALAIDPQNLSALKLLERIRANDRTRRNEVRLKLAAAVSDGKLAAALRLAAGEQELLPGGRPSEALVTQLKAAWAADPDDEALSLMLERALLRAQDGKGLIDLYQRRLARTADATDQAQLNLRIADACETLLTDPVLAARAYEAANEVSPGLYPALRGLARCYTAVGNPEKARSTLVQLGRAAKDQATAIEALLEAANLALAAEQKDVAAGIYREILEKEPLHPEAGPALENILTSKGGAADLAALHERRAQARLASRDGAAAAQELFGAAMLYAKSLNDAGQALGALEKLLAIDPAHADALALKGELCLGAERWADAAAALSACVQLGGEPGPLATLHLTLGALYQDRLADLTRATAHLQTVLGTHPDNPEALERIAIVYAESKNWSGAVDALRRLLGQASAPQVRARHLVMLARIAEEGFGDLSQASQLFKEALALFPGDPMVLERLTSLYERMNALPELAQVLETQALAQKDVRRSIALRLRVGELHAKAIKNHQKAISVYRGVLELEPENSAALAELGALYAQDPATFGLAIEAHRSLLRLDPARVDSVRALFRIWEAQRQLDKAFCAAGVLSFLRAANEIEAAFYSEAKNRLPQDPAQPLGAAEMALLHHPQARGPLVDVLRAFGDQLVKVHPPQLEAWGVDRKADRLKSDHAVYKAVRVVTAIFGVEEFDVYQAKKGLVTLETTEPLSVLVGPEVIRRFNAREQRFLFARAGLGLFDKTAVLRKLSAAELADLFGSSIRIHLTDWASLGRRNEEHSKALRKAYSRRAIKALEQPAAAAAADSKLDFPGTLEGLSLSADRAGLLLCADVAAGLWMPLKDEGTQRSETAETALGAVRERKDLRELLLFALSEDFFRLRQKVGLVSG